MPIGFQSLCVLWVFLAVEEQVQDLGKVAATLAELAAKMQAQAPSAA